MNTVELGKLIDEKEAAHLAGFVYTRPSDSSVHSAVMLWLTSSKPGKSVMKKFEENDVFPAYGAYLLEHYLKLK